MDIFELQKSNPELFPQFSVKDTLFLHYTCPQRNKVLPFFSKHISFAFTLSGKRIQSHGNHRLVASPNKGSFLKKCAYLQELPDDNDDWDVLLFYLKDGYLRSIFEEFRSHLSLNNLPEPNKEMIESFEIDEQIRSCYKSFLPYFGSNKPIPESLLENKFKELLFNLFSHPDNKHILAYILKIVDRHETPIREIMEENYMYNLKVKDFAKLANRSQSTFNRDFKKYYKTTPGKWLTNRRLKHAKSILETTNKTVSQTAFECGFTNVSHFSRVFKEKFNEAPSSFQKH